MSAIRFSVSRKRSHSPDFSTRNDSEDEAPPLKLKRRNSGIKVPQAFAVRLKNLVNWISDLPVKGFFKMAVKAGCALPEKDTMVDDDIIILDEDDEEKANPFVQRLEQLQKRNVSNSQRLSRQLEANRSSKYQTRGSDIICYYDSRNDSRKTRNGSWTPRLCRDGSYCLRPLQADNPTGMISNPPTDVEIFLEASNKTSTPEPELEIIEDEPSSGKAKVPCSVMPIRVSTRSATVKSISSHPGPSQSRLHSALKPYTAHEVVRLQEKAQYQALLEKYINGNQFRTISGKPKLSAVQVDQSGFEFSGDHFKKEILQQPISSFLEKYYKPCRPMLSVEKSQEPIEIVIDDDDDDDDDDDEDVVVVDDVKLPTYKPKYCKRSNFFSADWINELRSTVNAQSRERLKIVHEHERAIERYKKERLLELLNKDVGQSEPVEPEFPELTPEMDEMVLKALVGDPEEWICKAGNTELYRKDIETLSGLTWLNDSIISCYLDLIIARSKQEGYPSIYAFNSFFYTKFKTGGYSVIRRWTRKIDIFSFDLIFIPMHLELHWCLGVIDHRSKKICYYDSLGSSEECCLDVMHEYLCQEHKEKKGIPLDPSLYTCEVMKDIPQQMNGSDCGMFTLKYAEYVSRDAELTFNQKHMQYFRRRMIYEVLTNKLF